MDLEEVGDVALAKYQANRDAGALQESIRSYLAALNGASAADRPRIAWKAAQALSADAHHGKPEDLNAAINLARWVLDVSPPDPERLHQTAMMLLAHGTRMRDPRSFEEADDKASEALELTPPTDSARAVRLSTRALIRVECTNFNGDTTRLDGAVQDARDALALAMEFDIRMVAEFRSRLAYAFATRFVASHRPYDIDKAIQELTDAVAGTPQSDSAYPGRNADLGRVLLQRFDYSGDPADLDRAVESRRIALDAVPEDRSDRATFESELGAVLERRYMYRGNSQDIADAVAQLESALSHTYDADAVKNVRRERLAQALTHRSRAFERPDDLERAVHLLEARVSSTSPSDPWRSVALADLAFALYHRQRSGDLRAAADVLRDALDAAADADTRAALFGQLGQCQRAQFEEQRDVRLLDAAIANLRSALASLPQSAGHQSKGLLDWVRMLLAEALERRVLEPGATGDELQRAAALWRIVTTSESIGGTAVCVANASLAQLVSGAEQRAAFARSVKLLGSIHRPGLSLPDELTQMRGLWTIASDAAASFAEVGQAEEAVELLELGRSVLLNSRLRLRSETKRLTAARPDLAAALTESAGILAAANGTDPRASEDAGVPISLHRAAELRHESTLAEIRRTPGFETFNLPPRISQLRAAATRGAIAIVNIAAARCDVFIVDDRGVRSLPLPGVTSDLCMGNAGRFRRAVERLSAQGVSPSEAASARQEARAVLAWLWDAVAKPVLTTLGHTEQRTDSRYVDWPRIWWVPTGVLSLLPLHAAGHHAAAEDKTIRRDKTVLDRVVSSTVPSVQALLYAQDTQPPAIERQRLLLVGVGHAPSDRPLPGAVSEIRRITRLLDRDHLTVVTDEPSDTPGPAPSRSVIRPHLTHHAWAHFACHSIMDSDSPVRSRLVLENAEPNPLTVADFADADLGPSCLAYFSACSVARRDDSSLDEPIHFASAALMAGYTHVIGTFWEIPDTPETADTIYRVLTRPPLDWGASKCAVAVHTAVHQQRAVNPGSIHRWAAHTHAGP